MMRRSLPPTRRDPLVAELEKNDPRIIRRLMHGYLEYLDRSTSLAPRLCAAGVQAWVGALVNMPHFLASYRMVYRTKLSIRAHPWAAISPEMIGSR